ncbi:MAG: phage holin family protein [Clostridiales bacterium]|nr:phage holin family protein [Clostridiales bacterium]
MNLKGIVCTSIGIVGALISDLFGGWDAAMTTLIVFMSIDYVTGIIVAGVFRQSKKSDTGGLKSNVGWQGLCRKGVTLALVLMSCRLDIMMGTAYIKDTVVIAFCTNELISIVENAGLMGIPMPNIITRAIDILKHDSEEG